MNQKDKKNIVIIWAWPAGLTLAYELLSRDPEHFDVTILEQQDIVWGLAQTYNHKWNRIDIGGHRFFSKSQRVMDWWFSQMPLQGQEPSDYKKLHITSETKAGGPDPETQDIVMLERRRLSRIFWDRKFFDYPLSITRDTLSKFGIVDLFLCGRSYSTAKFHKYDMSNLEGFYKSRFGERLYERFFNAYTHKVWGKWPKDVSSARWAQRVKGLNLAKAVRDYFRKILMWNKQTTNTETSLIGKFYYPKLWPGQMWEIVADKVVKLGGNLVMNAEFVGSILIPQPPSPTEKGSSVDSIINQEAQWVEWKRNNVCALPITKDGKLLMQLKDMEAPILAGKLSSFGWGVDEGETIFEWLQRELDEELEMKVSKEMVKYIGCNKTTIWEKEIWEHIYEIKGFDAQELILHEGERIEELSLNGALEDERMAPSFKHNIEYYIEHANFNFDSEYIQQIIYKKDGKQIELEPDFVVSTMPMKNLLNWMEGADPEIKRLANLLEYRDFITVGILAKKLLVTNTSDYKTINNIIPDNRIYIHDKWTIVGRIQVFNNWSPYLVKDPDTVRLGMEYFCDKGDELRNKTDEELIALGIQELVSMDFLDHKDVLDGVVRRMEYTYPCYFGEGYEKFDILKNYLDKIENLYCIGRNGAHRYNNQDHSMLSSMILADQLIEWNINRNILWSINTEEEYHEKG
jgi:protoporphyrinogen oxidase/8-oxo-dGTP pyrophosphatase MutT (NUDIX family)